MNKNKCKDTSYKARRRMYLLNMACSIGCAHEQNPPYAIKISKLESDLKNRSRIITLRINEGLHSGTFSFHLIVP